MIETTLQIFPYELSSNIYTKADKRQDARSLPRPDFHFNGKVGRTYFESDPPQFPQMVKAPEGNFQLVKG